VLEFFRGTARARPEGEKVPFDSASDALTPLLSSI
jgi:hypothetical protein